MLEICFCIVGVLCIISYYFWCVYRIRCRFLYIWTYFKDMFEHFLNNGPEVWTIFVRNILFGDCLGFWVLNGPPRHHHTPPSPASMSKFPSVGKHMENNVFLMNFCDCYEKNWKCTKIITSCSIRRAGRLYYFLSFRKTYLDSYLSRIAWPSAKYRFS